MNVRFLIFEDGDMIIERKGGGRRQQLRTPTIVANRLQFINMCTNIF